MPHLPDLEAWAIFARVAEKGSFSQAAEELGLAKTTVSKAITRLEARMRATLFHRTTRKLSLTETGRLSLVRAQRILADGLAIETHIIEEAAVPRGRIRASVLTTFGEEGLAALIPAFLDHYPEIELDIRLNEFPVDLVAEGYDLAIQIGSGQDSTLRASRLFSLRRHLVAAPELIARHGMPAHPSELARLPALIATHIPQPHDIHFTHAQGEECHVHLTGALYLNSGRALMPALCHGIGFAAMPEPFIWEELQNGRLIELFPEWRMAEGQIFVVTPPGQARPARVRVFLDFLREHFGRHGWTGRPAV
jgi:DNA-binding transcriptional LysR family regulator